MHLKPGNEGSFESCSAWREGNDLPGRVGGNYG